MKAGGMKKQADSRIQGTDVTTFPTGAKFYKFPKYERQLHAAEKLNKYNLGWVKWRLAMFKERTAGQHLKKSISNVVELIGGNYRQNLRDEHLKFFLDKFPQTYRLNAVAITFYTIHFYYCWECWESFLYLHFCEISKE